MTLYHATTPKKAKKYRETGCICKPVRGFTTMQGAMNGLGNESRQNSHL